MRETGTRHFQLLRYLSWIRSPISTAFSWLWRYIWWLWGVILLSVFIGILTGVLGNFFYESIKKHKYNPADPHTWLILVLSIFTSYPLQTTIMLVIFVVLTAGIYIAKEVPLSHDNQTNEYTIKRLAHVDPEKDNIGIEKYKKRVYLKRAEHDTARDVMHRASTRKDNLSGQAIGICIIGRPTQGKTRLAWETMCNALPRRRWTFIKWPLEPQYIFDLVAFAQRRKKVVLWLDDLHLFAHPEKAAILNDLPRRFHNEHVLLLIVATCRDGNEGKQADKYFKNQLLKHLAKIHLEDISQQEADHLVEQLIQEGVQVQKFDGTPGSLILGVERMRDQRYPTLPKSAQQLLTAMKLLRSANIYTYSVPRVQGIAIELFERDTELRDQSILDDALSVLEAEDFVRLEIVSIEKRLVRVIKPIDVYLEQAVPNYPFRSANIIESWTELERILARKFDATGLSSLGTTFLESREGNPFDNQEHAKHCFQAALEIYTLERSPLDWARMKYNLANTLLDQATLVEGTARIEILGQAANTYYETLQVYSYEHTSLEWAQAHQKLGLVLSKQARLMEGETRLRALKEAERTLLDTLKVYSIEQTPLAWAYSQQYLGSVYIGQAQLEEVTTRQSLLEQAVSAFRVALGVYTKESILEAQADVQNLLGNALRKLVKLEGEANQLALLIQAVDAYKAALKIYSSIDMPIQMAQIYINLGKTQRDQAELAESAIQLSFLKQAADSYRSAAQIYTFEDAPDNWAEVRKELGDILHNEVEIAPRVEFHNLLSQAEDAYRDALKVFSPTYRPADWAMAQGSLGAVLWEQAKLAAEAEHQTLLKQAEEALRNALKVFSRSSHPVDWAKTQLNLGMILWEQAKLAAEAEHQTLLKQAEEALRNALKVFSPAYQSSDWAMAQMDLGMVLWEQAKLAARAEHQTLLKQAEEALRNALKAFSRRRRPADWAMAQLDLGAILWEQAKLAAEAEHQTLLKQAEEALRNTLKVFSPTYRSDDWAIVQMDLGVVLLDQVEHATETKRQTLLKQAEEALHNALKICSLEYRPGDWALTQFNLSLLHHTAASFMTDPLAKCLALRKAYLCIEQIMEIFNQETLKALYHRVLRRQSFLETELQKYNC